jgi:hypothetical protein
MLVHLADRWAKAPLLARVVLITYGNKPFTALGLPRTISRAVNEQVLLRISHGISCRAPGIGSSIQSFCRRVGTIVPPLTFCTLAALSPLVREICPAEMIMGSIPTMRVLVTVVGCRHPIGW